MSMSTHVIGLRDMDGEFSRMLAVKRVCEENNVSYPKEVQEYFHGEEYEGEEYLRFHFLRVDLSVTEWGDENSEGYELEVSRIPSGCKTIRFYNSW